jgi:hypothetical protein
MLVGIDRHIRINLFSNPNMLRMNLLEVCLPKIALHLEPSSKFIGALQDYLINVCIDKSGATIEYQVKYVQKP